MSTEEAAAPLPAPPWFTRLGLSGKILFIAALAGILVTFLPLMSVSVQLGGANPFEMLGVKGGPTPPAMGVSKTVMVVEDWRGKVDLLGYLAGVVLAFVLYPPTGLRQKALCWAGLGVGLLVAVFALWLLIAAFNSSSNNLMGLGSVSASVGFGTFLNVITGGAVTAAGFLKCREEKLI